MRKAMIKNDIVENIIIADDDFILDGYELLTLNEDVSVNIGDKVELIEDKLVFTTLEPMLEKPTEEEKLQEIISTLGKELAQIKLSMLGGV